MLCTICENVFSGKGEPFPPGKAAREFFHHTSSKALKIAAEGHCHLCNLLLRVMSSSVTTTEWAYSHFEDDAEPETQSHILGDRIVESGTTDPYFWQQSISAARSGDNATRMSKLYSEVMQKETHTRALQILQEGYPHERHNTLIYHCDNASIHKNTRTITFFFVSPKGRLGLRTTPVEFVLVRHVEYVPSFDDSTVYTDPGGLTNISSTSLRMARHWLRDCIQYHDGKCSNQDDSFRPTRLLRLPLWHDLHSEAQIRLEETPFSASFALAYMTLSHQWGDPEKMMKMTRDNIVSFQAGMKLSDIPLTFRQAIQFAAFCGIRYLWIDSLCIKQGDKEDWQREASKMADYYRNAICNLSATNSEGSAGGIFSEQGPWLANPLVVQLEPLTWNTMDMSPAQLFVCVPKTLWTSAIERAPINSRGWVVQERLFSSRKILFTNEQIFWECHTKKSCETFPRDVPDVLYHHSQYSMFHHKYRTPDALVIILNEIAQNQSAYGLPVTIHQRKNLLVAWGAVLTRYMSCNLTYQSDRLIAISSLAEKVQAILNDEYIYGIWKSELPFQLAFAYENTRQSRQSIPEVFIPTWSWAYRNAKLKRVPDCCWKELEDKIPLLNVTDICQHPDASVTTPSGEIVPLSAILKCEAIVFRCRPGNDSKLAKLGAEIWSQVDVGSQIIKLSLELDQDLPSSLQLDLIPLFEYNDPADGGYALVVVTFPAENSKVFMRMGCCRTSEEFVMAFRRLEEIQTNFRQDVWLV